MTTIQAIIYKRPFGDKQEVTVTKIHPDDAQYINDNGVRVSFEDIGVDTAIYFDDGSFLEDDETPDELVYMAGSKTCEEVMANAVEQMKKRKAGAL